MDGREREHGCNETFPKCGFKGMLIRGREGGRRGGAYVNRVE